MENSILPMEEIEKLKKEINNLKKSQAPDDSSDALKSSMMNLSRSINSLLQVFKQAHEDLKMDTHDAVLVTQKLDKLIERLDKIELQNEKIAKGIVAVADMVEEIQAASSIEKRSSVLHNLDTAQPQSQQTQPLPSYNLPPQEDKKKNFLNFKI